MRSTTFFAIFALSLTGLIEAYDPVKMLCLVNQQRQRAGRKPLGMSKALENAAQKHSDDQARMRSMTHTGSDGSSPGDRVSRAGYNWNGVAENVAYGYSDEEECMRQWMNSPGHRENILGDYTHFGSAVSKSGGTPYYTQDFGKQSGSYGNFPVCPSGAAYDTTTDSAPSNDYSSGGNNDYSSGGSAPSSGNYGGSAPSSSPRKYSSGGRSPSRNYGGSSPSSGNYGGRSPSSNNRYTTKRHSHKKPVKSYGGNVQDTNDYGVKDSNQSRKPAYGNKKYGGNVSDSNDSKPAYGNKVTYNGVKDSNKSRKPAYGPQNNPSYGNNDNSHGRRHGGKSYGNKGHSHGGRYGGRGRDD